MKMKRNLVTRCLSYIVLVFILFMIDPVVLLDNYFSANHIRDELPRARARWLSSNILDYEIDVEGSLPMACRIDARLTVRDGKLAAVSVRKGIFDPSSPLIPLEPEKWSDTSGCNYHDFVVHQMLAQVEEDLGMNLWDNALKVQFDPQYGFITNYETRYGYRYILSGASECCAGLKYRNFEPISR